MATLCAQSRQYLQLKANRVTRAVCVPWHTIPASRLAIWQSTSTDTTQAQLVQKTRQIFFNSELLRYLEFLGIDSLTVRRTQATWVQASAPPSGGGGGSGQPRVVMREAMVDRTLLAVLLRSSDARAVLCLLIDGGAVDPASSSSSSWEPCVVTSWSS